MFNVLAGGHCFLDMQYILLPAGRGIEWNIDRVNELLIFFHSGEPTLIK